MKKDNRKSLVGAFVRAGERTDRSGNPVRNGILRTISHAEFRMVRPHLALVAMPNHSVLQEPRAAINFAYFPNDGLASIVVAMKGERDVEAGGSATKARWILRSPSGSKQLPCASSCRSQGKHCGSLPALFFLSFAAHLSCRCV